MNYPQHEAFTNAQNVDALQVAEELAAEDGDPSAKAGYGLALLERKRQLTQAICSENDDIHYDMGIDECLRILSEEGFSAFATGKTKHGHSWLLWNEDLKILGTISSYTLHTGFEKLNALNFYNQFIGSEVCKHMASHGHHGGGTVMVRRSDLQDIWVRNWNVRDGLRHFMEAYRTSGAQPVEQWVSEKIYLRDEDQAAMNLLPQSALDTINAKVDVLAISELHKFGL